MNEKDNYSTPDNPGDSGDDFSEMYNSITSSIDMEHTNAMEHLKEAISDRYIQSIAQIDGNNRILSISELPEEVRVSESFIEALRNNDWPNSMTDGKIESPQKFESAEDFLDMLTPIDRSHYDDSYVSGRRHIASSRFFTLLSIKPIDVHTSKMSIHDALGLLPTLHRGYAAAPDLFESLRVVLSKLPQMYSSTYHLIKDEDVIEEYNFADEEGLNFDRDNLLDYLKMSEDGKSIVEAMMLGYQILGRLVCEDDARQMMARFGAPLQKLEQYPLIDKADKILIEGF